MQIITSMVSWKVQNYYQNQTMAFTSFQAITDTQLISDFFNELERAVT